MSLFICIQDNERAIGLPQLLKDTFYICLQRNKITDHIQSTLKSAAGGPAVFCLEDHDLHKGIDSSFKMLKLPKVIDFIRKNNRGGAPKILVFKNIPKIQKLADQYKWQLLNNPPRFNQVFEDKVNFLHECQKAGLSIPPSFLARLHELKFSKIKRQLGLPVVLQFRRGHAGESTHFIYNENDLKKLQNDKVDYPLKLTKFIKGPTLTYNICISSKTINFSNLMYQITGLADYNAHEGGTCGVDMIFAKRFTKYEKSIKSTIEKLAITLQKENYRGLLGVDFIFEEATKQAYIIECNPRLTANISLNTQVELMQSRKPLMVDHISEFSAGEFLVTGPKKQAKTSAGKTIVGSYFIIRNIGMSPVKIVAAPKAGKYRLLKNQQVEFINDSLELGDCNKNEFILFVENTGSIINSGMKYATITAPFSVLTELAKKRHSKENHVQIEANPFVYFIKNSILTKEIYIHPDQFWPDSYAMPRKKIIDLFVKPLKNFDKLSDKAISRNRQSQATKSEGDLQILGEFEGYYLAKKWDATLGWARKTDLKLSPSGNLLPIAGHSLAKKTDRIKKADLKKISDANVKSFLKQFSKAPYLWGGITPQGIDCSGFTQQYFLQLFNFGLPKHSLEQMKYGHAVNLSELRDHDLIFLRHKKTGRSHVGVAHQQKIINASFLSNKVAAEDLSAIAERYEIIGCRRLSL